jgi:hypothetical protein
LGSPGASSRRTDRPVLSAHVEGRPTNRAEDQSVRLSSKLRHGNNGKNPGMDPGEKMGSAAAFAWPPGDRPARGGDYYTAQVNVRGTPADRIVDEGTGNVIIPGR